jgi:putative transposase
MWAEAFTRHRHVPLDLYIDNGSGHKNKLMSTDGTGFYDRAGVCVTHAHPGNPHGKGWIERFFRIMKEDFLKLWQPEFYFGGDMAPEIKNKITREVRAGHRKLPSAAQFADAFNAWLARYHSRPHPEMPGRSIASVWAELEPVSPALDEISLKRQVTQISVVRGMLNHGKRKYRAPELLAYTGQKLLLEYDLLDDQVAIVCTLDGRFICDAALVSAIDVFAPNRQEEKRQQRAQGQAKRTALRADVQRARAGLLIDAEATAVGTHDLLDVPTRLISNGAEDDFDIDIDITELSPSPNRPTNQPSPTQGDLDD